MNLKRIAIICAALFCFTKAFSQQIELGGLYSYCGWYSEWRNCYGYSLAYHWNKNDKKRKSIFFSHYLKWTEYDDSKEVEEWHDPSFIIKPLNQRFSFRYMKTWNVLKRTQSLLWYGYVVGVDVFHYNEDFLGIHTGEQFNKTATYLGLLGLGPVVEYEVKNVFMENLSFSFRFNPEFTHMGEWILGSIVPYPGYWLNCLVSVKYDIAKK